VWWRLHTHPRTADATHNIMAYRIGDGAAEGRVDDGEGGAGDKLLFLLQHAGARGVAVVVSRWYGGIHLGGDRFRIITRMVRWAFYEFLFLDET
jgi:putative IMPACT (imprinted ancient) family translation regulator